MSKRIHNVIFQPGTDEADFLANEAAGMQVHCNFDLWDGMIAMMLTDEEAETLRASSKVIECGPERDVQELVSYPSTTPRYETSSVTYRTKFNPTGNGAENTGLNMFFTSEFKTADGTQPFGYFQGTEYQFDDTVKSNYLGEYVDIVAIEAGSPASGNAGHEDHVDFEEWDSNNSKFVPMEWSDTSSSMTSARNNQVTNNNTNWFSSHAIGVLSAAGGKYCGWGKKSSLRVMYLADGVTTAYYTALTWHINKPVNPVTGVRNATVVTGAWGFVGVDHERFYKINDISQIVAYQADGSSETITRNNSYKPKTWNITMTASGSSAYEVTGDDRIYAKVAGDTQVSNRVITVKPGDTVVIDNQASGGHPLYIRKSGTNVAGVSGQGTSTVTVTMPEAGDVYDYICDYHGGMTGEIRANVTNNWYDDYRPFVDNLLIPRVIEDPADSTDKWMISIPDQTRYSAFDTVMSQYNSYNGIYAFTSAGNNSHIGVSPTDPRFNTSITVDAGSTYVTNTITNDRNTLTSSTQGSQTTVYPLRAENTGGDNQFTIAACQQDDVNRLMDDYSSRGPQIDFAAYGAFTWTSYPTGTYSDGKWGYFSGTSCAAPLAAGCATVFLEHYFTERGVYPSIAKLKDIMVNAAKENLIGDTDLSTDVDDGIDFQNVSGSYLLSATCAYQPQDLSSSKLYASTEVNRIKDNNYQNGGAELTELYGTPALRVHIPWGIRMGNGKYIAGGSEQTTNGRRPVEGRTWPRQKVSFSS